MRVAYLSGIHADIVEALRKVDLDIFVICGDISHGLEDIEYPFRKL